MTTPSSTDSPLARRDTPVPAPYRLDTSAILIARRPVDTATLTAIRARIEPRAGWWQFELRPWHYAVALAAVFGCSAAVVAVVLTHAAVR